MARDKKNLTPFQIWFEEAWEGWIRPLGAIIILGIGVLLYRFDMLPERLAGVLVVLAIVVGTLAMGLVPAWPMAAKPWQRALVVMTALTALVGCLYPTLRTAIPAPTLAEVSFVGAKTSETVTTGRDGPYDLTVSGRLKATGQQEGEAGYNIKVVDNGGGTDEISGAVSRHYVVYRSRKGSKSSLDEHNEKTYRLTHVRGPQVTLSVDSLDEQLDGPLVLQLRHAGPDPILFIVLGALALVLGLVLDAKLVDIKGKLKAYVLPTVAIAYVFSLYYPEEATPNSLVKPAISYLLLALLIGGLGGWILGLFVKLLFTPKVKKAPSRR